MAAFNPWPKEEKQLKEGWLFFLAVGLLYFQQKAQEETLQKALYAAQDVQGQLESQIKHLNERLEAVQREKEDLEKLMQQRGQELLRLEARLMEYKTREEFVLGHLREVVVLFEASGRTRYISPSVEALIGYKPHELEAFFRPGVKGGHFPHA